MAGRYSVFLPFIFSSALVDVRLVDARRSASTVGWNVSFVGIPSQLTISFRRLLAENKNKLFVH